MYIHTYLPGWYCRASRWYAFFTSDRLNPLCSPSVTTGLRCNASADLEMDFSNFPVISLHSAAVTAVTVVPVVPVVQVESMSLAWKKWYNASRWAALEAHSSPKSHSWPIASEDSDNDEDDIV